MPKPPKQKPGSSRQDYGTPPEFISEVIKRFGPLAIDLACDESNAVCGRGIKFPEQDSLATPWRNWQQERPRQFGWLNPPFADIEPWAKKCRDEMEQNGVWSLLLTPASIGSEWYRNVIHGSAYVLALNPRLTFVGETAPYPKDLMLSAFCPAWGPGFSVWRWR